ncbi:hypothetical protein [Hydrogenophaga palleronii]|uniref:hypothetical protein n=1 Tax=Hydrogenophaga palleronii TaxID=65655 RepID=UPI00082632AF|nr:hypothetical protein [Hydrogenophaga palleronii]
MDSSLQALSPELLGQVEDQLSNNEVSSDEELAEDFIQAGLTEAQARQAIGYRDRYLINVYHQDFTPMRTPGRVLRFNPHARDFEPE